MPFTFSHPAIILPLKYLPKKWFSFTALVIGSLTPDFEYFLRMKVKSIYSHTLSGILWFDLPLALLLTFIFHNIVRNLLYQNLPTFMQKRIAVFTQFDWNLHFKKNWTIILISFLIGISSHIFWDAFTHNHGYFVNEIDSLKNTVSLFGTAIPFWKISQHLSSFIGSIIIILAFFKLPKNLNFKTSINKLYWALVILLTFGILCTRFAANPQAFNIGNLVVSSIASILISLIIIPLVIKFKLITKK